MYRNHTNREPTKESNHVLLKAYCCLTTAVVKPRCQWNSWLNHC